MKLACLALIAVTLLLTASVVPACEKAGPVLTITDAETRRNLSFVAAAEVLQGVAVRDQVAVAYAREGERLRATSVRKLGG